LVGFKYQKGYDWLDLNSKQEGVRLVGFKYEKCYDWLDSQFHCSHLESRGVPEKPRGKKRGKLSPFHFRWRHFRWCNFRSRLRTRSLPAPPHSTPSNANWAVPIYYFGISVRGPESQEGVRESLKGTISVANDVLFWFFHYYFLYFQLKSSILRKVLVCPRDPKAVLFHLAKFLLEALIISDICHISENMIFRLQLSFNYEPRL
jgi:hypothetical protein